MGGVEYVNMHLESQTKLAGCKWQNIKLSTVLYS